MRVVVTGGAGFIGVHTVEALVADGDDVLVIDDFRHASSRPLPASARVQRHDVATRDAAHAVAAFHPDALIHLAAQGGVNRSWREPDGDARCNVLGAVNMLNAAAGAGVPSFVLASSGGALYGDAQRLPSREDDAAAPRSPYGTAKLAAEAYLELYGRTSAMAVCALRYGNVYGPGQDGSGEAGLVAISCTRLLGGAAPQVRGDGLQTRDFVFVADVAQANVRALHGNAGGAVNVGTGVETSVRDVVAILCDIDGHHRAPSHGAAVAAEVRRSCLDVARARETLVWEASTPLAEGLRATYAAFATAAARA